MARPPDTTSVVVMFFASSPGSRKVTGLTSGPMRIVSVTMASHGEDHGHVEDGQVRSPGTGRHPFFAAGVRPEVADRALHDVVGRPERVEPARLGHARHVNEARERLFHGHRPAVVGGEEPEAGEREGAGNPRNSASTSATCSSTRSAGPS